MKNAKSRDRARFLPSSFIPLRIFVIIGGNMSSVIVRFLMLIASPVNFFSSIFGVFSLYQSRACSRSSFASSSSGFGMNDFVCVIFSGSASVGLKFSICSFVIGIDARAVFSCREYGALKRCLDETRTMSTASCVDLIVSSVLNSVLFGLISPPYELVASRFTVLILQFLQKFISLWETRFILPLHDGHIISFRFDFIDSTSVLHLMSGHWYFPTIFLSVIFAHFGQICSDVNSPVASNFSLPVRFKISWFIGSFILSKR